MTYPKFIITDTGWLRLGHVVMHKDLLKPNENCLGGGFYEFDYTSGILLLSGKSYDFGIPKWSWLDSVKVPDTYSGFLIIYRYDDSYEDDFMLSRDIPVEYVKI